MKNSSGFTLLEVMLSLLVMGIALSALVHSGQVSSQTVSYLEHSSAAYHVADQTMMGLYQASGLTNGKHQGEQRFANQRWYWQATVENTDNPHIAKISLQVASDKSFDHVQAQLTGFTQQ